MQQRSDISKTTGVLNRLLRCALGLLFLSVFITVSQAANPFILVQSTTSTQNSGLYDHLLPKFFQKTGIEVRVVAVGTGQAIKNAMNGDGDILLVHAKEAEEAFVAASFGVARYDLMFNDFVLVGPAIDPAGLHGKNNIADAFRTLADRQIPFASRGDDSGTHKKERRIWDALNRTPKGKWYLETGSGMGATLNLAIATGAYVLTDRASWIKFGNKANHKILVEGDPTLFNQYGIIVVDPKRHPHVKSELATTFQNWLLSPEGQTAISEYRVDGQQLFFPNAAQ